MAVRGVYRGGADCGGRWGCRGYVLVCNAKTDCGGDVLGCIDAMFRGKTLMLLYFSEFLDVYMYMMYINI